MSIKINDQLPPFSVAVTSNKTITNKDLENKYSIIYFYPKDSTPGCTTEGLDFTALHPEFSKVNTQIFGVSLDSMKRHDNFRAKQNFSFDLISDPDAVLCNIFGVYQLKKNFGKEYMGIVRSTFLIDPTGKLVKEWRSVKVKEHAQSVLNTVKELQQA
ncbi:MAG: peroxiredoxin [Pseudomonadota bacterium]|nr:peroxiredoxin [Pseudomonadota bacterium]